MKIFISGKIMEGKTTVAHIILKALAENGIKSEILCDDLTLIPEDHFNKTIPIIREKLKNKIIDIVECQEVRETSVNKRFMSYSQLPLYKNYKILEEIDIHE